MAALAGSGTAPASKQPKTSALPNLFRCVCMYVCSRAHMAYGYFTLAGVNCET